MRLARPFTLVPWLALALIARVVLGPEGALPPFAAEPAPPMSTAAAVCGSDACGCPHGVEPESCCCADESVSPVRASSPALSATAHDARTPTLESFECSGGRPRVAARASGRPVALAPTPMRVEGAAGAEWTPRSEPGPLFDLETEPPTPPPRTIAS